MGKDTILYKEVRGMGKIDRCAKCVWGEIVLDGVPNYYRKKSFSEREDSIFLRPKKREMEAIKDAFCNFPKLTTNGEKLEFLSEYYGIIEHETAIDVVLDKRMCHRCSSCLHNIPRHCEQKEHAPFTDMFHLKTCEKWNQKYHPTELKGKTNTTITLADVRNDKHTTKLLIERPQYRGKEGKKTVDLFPMQFFEQRITSRLAIAIADLYYDHPRKLIAEGFGISESTIDRSINKWKRHTVHEKAGDGRGVYWVASGVIGEECVIITIDPESLELVELSRSAETETYREWKEWRPSRDVSCFLLGGDSRAFCTPDLVPFVALSYFDVYSLLYQIYLSEISDNAEVSDIDELELINIFEDVFEQLKIIAQKITEMLSSADAVKQSSLDEAMSFFERQLQILLLLSRSENKTGKPLFPALAKMIMMILNNTVPIKKDPLLYQKEDPSYLNGDRIIALRKVFAFLKSLQKHGKDPGDLEVRINRLMLFNDAAVGKAQLKSSTNGKREAESAFASLMLEDFYQLRIPARYPRIACLTHLIEQGLLETRMPVSNLHCVADRLENGKNAKCQLPHCPVLDVQ